MTERHALLRAAPEPRVKEIPDNEAVDLAKTAFYAARREQMTLMAGSLNNYLFDPTKVNYRRLKALKSMARKQVETAQRVEQLINDSIEALEATRPVQRSTHNEGERDVSTYAEREDQFPCGHAAETAGCGGCEPEAETTERQRLARADAIAAARASIRRVTAVNEEL